LCSLSHCVSPCQIKKKKKIFKKIKKEIYEEQRKRSAKHNLHLIFPQRA